MIRVGRVVEAAPDRVLVCFERLKACENCKGCGAADKEVTVSMKGTARVGDRVSVEMGDATVLSASALAYLVPLVAVVGGLVLGRAMVPQHADLAGLGLAGGLLVAALVFLKMIDKRLSKKRDWSPYVVAVLDEKE